MTHAEAFDKLMRICHTIFQLTLEGGPLRECPFCHEMDDHDPDRCLLLEMEIHLIKILYNCQDDAEPSRPTDATDRNQIILNDTSLIPKWRRTFGRN